MFFSCLEGTKNASKSIETTWKMLSEKGMKNVANMVPKWRQNGSRNPYKIEKYREKWTPKSMRKFATFQEVPKIEQISPRCDLEPIRGQRVEPGWWTFASQGPQGAATSTRTRQKKEGERQKERRTKKERVRKVEKGTRGIWTRKRPEALRIWITFPFSNGSVPLSSCIYLCLSDVAIWSMELSPNTNPFD